MHTPKNAYLSLLGLTAVILAILPTPTAVVQSAELKVQPPAGVTQIGDTISIDFLINDAHDVFGSGLDFQYKTAQLRYLSAVEGPFLSTNDQINTIAVFTVDTLAGSVIAGITRSNYLDGGASSEGDTLLLSLRFTVLSGDSIPLVISQSSLIGTDGITKIPHSVKDGFVIISHPTWAEEREISPGCGFSVDPPYPNPSNSEVQFIVRVSRADHLSVAVYNTLGQEVRGLVSGRLSLGKHHLSWDGRDDGGNVVATGVYIARFQSSRGYVSRKVVYLE